MESTFNPTRQAIPGFCGLCKSRCGSLMITQNGRLIAQEPNPDHPTGQSQCMKGKAAPELVYNPQRLLYPVIRTRPKGDADPGWKRISWDEALQHTASAIDRIRNTFGPEAVAVSIATPSGTPIADDIRWIERFANAFGSPNVVNGTEICNWHKDFTHAYTLGRGIGTPDFENSNCIVLWGHNPGATWLNHANAISTARARGAKIIVVDPRQSSFATGADQWLRVRPGADAALALGISREIISKGWFDKAFTRDFTNGPLLVRTDTSRFLRARDIASPLPDGDPNDMLALSRSGQLVRYKKAAGKYDVSDPEEIALIGTWEQKLADGSLVLCKTAFTLFEEACRPYDPDYLEKFCWIDAEQVTEVAKILHEASPVSYYCWAGVCQHTNASQTDRAIATMMALTGHFDAKGGNVTFPGLPVNDVSGKEFLSAEQRAKCIGLARSRLGPARFGLIGSDTLYDAILDKSPKRIRALIGFGRNLLLNHANADRGSQALSALEFYVHTDVTLTPTAHLADIVLPINTPWEREALRIGFEGSEAAEQWVQLRQAAIPSLGESRSDAEVVFELAKRLGMGDLFWNGNIHAGMEYMLKPLNLSLDALKQSPNGVGIPTATRYKKYLQEGFKTDTGKIELYSEIFLEHGQSPLPSFVEPAMSPYDKAYEQFPLVLTTSKVVGYRHSQDRQVASLRQRAPDPEVHIHPQAAQQRSISEGDWVSVRSPHGKICQRAKFDDSLDPRVVWAEYGWWQNNDALGMKGYDPLADTGANFSRLISDQSSDPISGSLALRSYLCDVEPLAGHAPCFWPGWRPFKIVSVTNEAKAIKSFQLAPVDGLPLPSFRGGQHIVLRAGPGEEKWVRCYSLSAPPSHDRYRITVKQAESASGAFGKMSGFLHAISSLPETTVEVMSPRGDFQVITRKGAPPFPICLIAGGIGITPLLSMLYQLKLDGWENRIELFYAVASGENHAFAEEIQALTRTMSRLNVTTFYSNPSEADRKLAGYDCEGHILPEHLMQSAANRETRFFICGSPRMMANIKDCLNHLKVQENRIFAEAFGPFAKQPPAKAAAQPVTLARSGKTLLWQPGAGTLLELVEKSGIGVKSGCRVGQCESCAVKLLEGKVFYPESHQQADDFCLLCTAIPLTPILIDI